MERGQICVAFHSTLNINIESSKVTSEVASSPLAKAGQCDNTIVGWFHIVANYSWTFWLVSHFQKLPIIIFFCSCKDLKADSGLNEILTQPSMHLIWIGLDLGHIKNWNICWSKIDWHDLHNILLPQGSTSKVRDAPEQLNTQWGNWQKMWQYHGWLTDLLNMSHISFGLVCHYEKRTDDISQ